ncbi:MAG: GH116 family glycosyl hydrolase [Ignavibacteriales bacterium]|nr:GH116 family glycosyl hydrolase [Ignavibacteriales bacterium]
MRLTIHIEIIFLLIFLVLTAAAQTKIVRTAFLSVQEEKLLTPELKAAYDFLKSNKEFQTKLITFTQLKNNPSLLKNLDVVWYHKSDTLGFSKDETDAKVIESLKNYITNGGNLFLTMEAFNYVVNMNLETEIPKVKYVESKDEGYGRKLGLHSFRNHPIFDKMFGGAYIWNAYEDNRCRQIGYFDDVIPNGKVVAVDWAYITLFENSKLILEYEQGKGKIIAVGAYTYFAPRNFNRPLLELFTKNSINYLAGKLDGDRKFYWSYKPQELVLFTNPQSAITIPQSKVWDRNLESMKLTSLYGSENFYDVAGQRMVIMGKEKGGIDEIWAHPFMALRDYEVGIQFSYRDTVYWLGDQRPFIEVKPESFTRTYNYRRAFLKEVVIADPEKPVGVVHYEYRGLFPAKLIIKFKSNMRYMWPYSERALGSIYYNFDSALNAYTLKDGSGDFNVIVGSNKIPLTKLEGKFDSFAKKDSVFTGKETKKFQFAAIQQFSLKENDNMDIVIVATDQGKEEALTTYKDAIQNPETVYQQITKYTRGILKDKLTITSPDKDFNEGYRWAMIGTDRFFVHTPGVGKSMVAGYSTTATGWDGNQTVSGRPGYAWYFGRDGQWSGYALLDYGDFAKVKDLLEFFQKYQDLTGKIFHELTTSGVVHYDAADATPLYIILAGKYLRHSGDVEFIRKSWDNIKKAVDYCFSTDTDGDHLIENTNIGHGWVEGGKLYGTHTTLYLAGSWAAALREASNMANKLGLDKESKFYSDESSLVTNIINKDFWNEKRSFYYDGKFKDGTYLDEPTVQVSVPIYFNTIEKNRIPSMLDEFASNNFSPDWGVRIVSEKSPLFKPYGYHYGSVWPLFTGWASLAEYKNGKYDQGFFHVMANLNVYKNWALGFVEEVINGAEYKPSGVCRHQCWSETMVLQPLLEGMLGLEPSALENKIKLAPHFPADWDFAEVENARSGSQNLSFKMKREMDKTIYTFEHSGNKPLEVEFNPSFPLKTNFEKLFIDGKQVELKIANEQQAVIINSSFTIDKKAVVEVYHKGGIAVIPVVTNPIPGDSSRGFRIISSKIDGNDFVVSVEGKNGNQEVMQVYCPAKNIQSVENGEIAGEENGIYKIRINFVHPSGKYVNKEIKIITNPH